MGDCVERQWRAHGNCAALGHISLPDLPESLIETHAISARERYAG
jgi:hypothetical protein